MNDGLFDIGTTTTSTNNNTTRQSHHTHLVFQVPGRLAVAHENERVLVGGLEREKGRTQRAHGTTQRGAGDGKHAGIDNEGGTGGRWYTGQTAHKNGLGFASSVAKVVCVMDGRRRIEFMVFIASNVGK